MSDNYKITNFSQLNKFASNINPKMLKLSYRFLLVFIFLTFCFYLSSTQNTHQNITNGQFKILKAYLKKGDEVRVSIFNTNAQFGILFQIVDQEIYKTKQSICFIGQQCSLQFTSEWESQAYGILDVNAYEYSYEFVINGEVVKRQDDSINNFIDGKFTYSKHLKPETYNIRVYYESVDIPRLTFFFMEQKYILSSGKRNHVNVTLFDDQPLYYLAFLFSQQTIKIFIEKQIEITVQIPNQMLIGCDGSNIYDPRTRSCPITQFQTEDKLTIHKYGYYPTFEIKQSQKTTIKIIIPQFIRWRQLFENTSLTLYMANSSNQHIFNNLTKSQLTSKFKNKQQCKFKSVACTFVFKLQPGNYTVMPFLGPPIVYLFQRSDGKVHVDSFYSVLPSFGDEDRKFHFAGFAVQFMTSNQEYSQIQINCDSEFLLVSYSILQRSTELDENGQFGLIIVQVEQSVFNKNLSKAVIPANLEINTPYLFFAQIVSKQKVRTLVSSQLDGGEGNQNEQEIDKAQQRIDIMLETSAIDIIVRNGNFPHRKLIQPTLSQGVQRKGSQYQQASEQKINIPLIIIVALSCALIFGISIFCVIKKCLNSKNQNEQPKQIVTEHSVSDNLGSSTIQIPQMSKNQEPNPSYNATEEQ